MNEHSIHTVRREESRNGDGTFGTQEHSAPEATLAELPDFRSDRARMMDGEIAGVKKRLAKMMEGRRDEHLLDIARQLPADVTRVVFRAEYDRDGNKHMLMYDHADDVADIDTANISRPMQDWLYGVAWDFGAPGDFVADDWMDGENEFYWVDLDEETALNHAHNFEWEMKAEQEQNGYASLRAALGRDAWVERAARARAYTAGIRAIHMHLPEEKSGVEVVLFETTAGEHIRPSEMNEDHQFIQQQIARLAHRTGTMTDSGIPTAPITLKV